jgi:hypothetical protein
MAEVSKDLLLLYKFFHDEGPGWSQAADYLEVGAGQCCQLAGNSAAERKWHNNKCDRRNKPLDGLAKKDRKGTKLV